MSGYGGPDDHNANIEAVISNFVDVIRSQLPDASKPSAEYCEDHACGEPIPEGRRVALPGVQYCVDCADKHVTAIRIRAVDHIL